MLYWCCCLDEEQTLIQSNESSNANANANARNNCRNLIQKRAHTIDDFMTGKEPKFNSIIHFSLILAIKTY